MREDDISLLQRGDLIIDEFGYELEVYLVEKDRVHVQAISGATFTYYQEDFDNGIVERFWSY